MIKSENIDNRFKKFLKILRKISETSENIFGSLRYTIKIFENYFENIQKKFGTFRELLQRISIYICFIKS